KIPLFLARLVAQVGRLLRAGVPGAFLRIDFVHGIIYALAVAHLVEHEELRLRAEIGSIADAGTLQVGLGLLSNVASVAAIGLAGDGVPDVADQDQRCRRGERVEERRGRVRDDQHVAFLDLLKSAYRGTVEADALLESISIDRAWRDGEMLPNAGQVGKAQIDHFD